MNVINNTKTLIDFFISNYVSNVNVAVDMTLGNGYDSKLILEKLNPKKLYSFDIQSVAIENSKKLLSNYKNYHLILDSHSNFDKYISEKIDFAMYNLGYLPKGDKNITTNFTDVSISLKKLLVQLNNQGIVFITFYVGHSFGKYESEKIPSMLQDLNQKEYSVLKFTFENHINNPLFVIMIQKIK